MFHRNQIRDEDKICQQPLQRVTIEHSPRYFNIKWQLENLVMNFKEITSCVNAIVKRYE
jgi:hypothetical protein